jgi:hypothetical protein
MMGEAIMKLKVFSFLMLVASSASAAQGGRPPSSELSSSHIDLKLGERKIQPFDLSDHSSVIVEHHLKPITPEEEQAIHQMAAQGTDFYQHELDQLARLKTPDAIAHIMTLADHGNIAPADIMRRTYTPPNEDKVAERKQFHESKIKPLLARTLDDPSPHVINETFWEVYKFSPVFRGMVNHAYSEINISLSKGAALITATSSLNVREKEVLLRTYDKYIMKKGAPVPFEGPPGEYLVDMKRLRQEHESLMAKS